MPVHFRLELWPFWTTVKYALIFLKFQALARFIIIIHFAFPVIVTFSLFNGSQSSRSLNSCLGVAEQNFLNGGIKFCTEGNFIDIFLCKIAYLIYVVISSSLIEAFLLYKCFKKIQVQNETAKYLMGKNSYIKRKQWVKAWN